MHPDKRRRVVDTTARRAITGGGLVIIASILAMMVFLVKETLPLWGRASLASVEARPGSLIGLDGPAPILSVNAFREILIAGTPSGTITASDLRDGAGGDGAVLADASTSFLAAMPTDAGNERWVAISDAGTILSLQLDDGLTYSGAGRSYRSAVTIDSLSTLASSTDSTRFAFARAPALAATTVEEGVVVAATTPRGVHIDDVSERVTPLGKVRRRVKSFELPVTDPGDIRCLALGDRAQHLYVGRNSGDLEIWPVERDTSAPFLVVDLFEGSAVTALTPLLGGTTIVAGAADGRVETWFLARGEGADGFLWVRSHQFDAHRAAIEGIAPSNRDKGFVTWDVDGELALHFATSGETRVRTTLDGTGPRRVVMAPKANALAVSSADGSLSLFDIDNPHPEISAGTLFGKVHYEGYPEPTYAWQSTGATDATEPKLSLVPLIFGTLKGTVYALLFSIPIAVLAAMYTALFMRPNLRAIVKPSMELMAAMPSVVLGLLAALWLAPRLQEVMPIFLAAPLYVALVFVVAGWAWRYLPESLRTRVPAGVEAIVLVPVLVFALALFFRANGWVDGAFDGGFLSWLFEHHEIRYDQRNAIIVGVAMGLAIIPIIFSISEDALSAVPRHLTAGSLALGASPWQTAWQVVLPAASPGIFSAIMIGFGRAVGETMIVLMATGNTPIMDWSIFNGFRTLSANIAVEIPEAPHGGSLYRLLFLAALLLFGITFIVNTAAELVRHRLRDKLSRF